MTDAVKSFANLSNLEKNIYKKLFATRVKRDHDDYGSKNANLLKLGKVSLQLILA